MLLISILIPLWSENILYTVSIWVQLVIELCLLLLWLPSVCHRLQISAVIFCVWCGNLYARTVSHLGATLQVASWRFSLQRSLCNACVPLLPTPCNILLLLVICNSKCVSLLVEILCCFDEVSVSESWVSWMESSNSLPLPLFSSEPRA